MLTDGLAITFGPVVVLRPVPGVQLYEIVELPEVNVGLAERWAELPWQKLKLEPEKVT